MGEGWAARLDLTFGRAGGKTAVRDARHSGPLQVQRPFYPEGESVCHVYVLHPPGGVVGGDSLDISVRAETGSHALITTPAAGKFYRSANPYARVRQTLSIETGATVEWLPQEAIVYSGARVKAATRIELEEGARFLGWEVVCLGLPASGWDFVCGDFRQSFEVWRGGEPLLLERGACEGLSEALTASWGLGGRTVFGCLVSTASDPALIERVRSRGRPNPEDELATATVMNGLTVCRYLGRDGFRAMQYFASVWDVLRPALCGRPACPPRIWRT